MARQKKIHVQGLYPSSTAAAQPADQFLFAQSRTTANTMTKEHISSHGNTRPSREALLGIMHVALHRVMSVKLAESSWKVRGILPRSREELMKNVAGKAGVNSDVFAPSAALLMNDDETGLRAATEEEGFEVRSRYTLPKNS